METIGQFLLGVATFAVVIAMCAGAVKLGLRRMKRRSVRAILERHFKSAALERLAVSQRQFPFHMRADLQEALQEYLRGLNVALFVGLRSREMCGKWEFNLLFNDDISLTGSSPSVGPPQYEQLDIGSDEPIEVLQNGLWLLERDGEKFAMLYSSEMEYGSCGPERQARLQIAASNGDGSKSIVRELFRYLETAMTRAQCYRGKILSLEQEASYYGQSSGLKVHRLSGLERDQVILPAKTLDLLDRNVIDFVAKRASLSRLRMATKKGLLFYGPPGTGKTHTIRYLAGALPGHTTFLISAEQVGLLGEYMTLARLLQPSLVIIEDVDLIARERTQMRNGTTEILLNKLLNEMDGLKEDCEILFVLTTNRPEDLEAALASRPGRIDQAIEFPLPDEQGRAKLARLYSRGLTLSDELVNDVVRRTKNVSASFIKELMRRAAQFHLESNGTKAFSIDDITRAIDEMLFGGGRLNLKLLGAEAHTS